LTTTALRAVKIRRRRSSLAVRVRHQRGALLTVTWQHDDALTDTDDQQGRMS